MASSMWPGRRRSSRPRFVLGHDRIEIGRLVADDAHVGEGLAHLRAPEADVLQGGHDPGEQQAAEHPLALALVDVVDAVLGVVAEALPQLLRQKAVAHPVAGVGAELLAVVALGLGQLRVVVTKGQATEHDVACLVLHDIGVDRLAQRVARRVADEPEGGQGQPLDQDLHPQVGHVPARVAEHVVEQRLEVVVDRIGDLDLVEVPRIGLDVASLVHHLGGGVVLRVDVGHRLHDLGRADQRTLLTVEELAELPGHHVPPHVAPLGRSACPTPATRRWAPARRAAAAGSPGPGRGTSRSARGIPLLLLALVVEVDELVPPVVVVPGEPGRSRLVRCLPAGLVHRQLVHLRRHRSPCSLGP